MYVDKVFLFRVYKNITLENAMRKDDRVHQLESTNWLTSGPIQKIQVVYVHEVAKYGAKLWW